MQCPGQAIAAVGKHGSPLIVVISEYVVTLLVLSATGARGVGKLCVELVQDTERSHDGAGVP